MYTHDIIHECLGKAFQSQAKYNVPHIASVLLKKATVSSHLFTCFYLEVTPDTLWLRRPIYFTSGFPLRWDALWRRSVYSQASWAKDKASSSRPSETWTLLEISFFWKYNGKTERNSEILVRGKRKYELFTGLEMRILLIAEFGSLQIFFFRFPMHVNTLVFS